MTILQKEAVVMTAGLVGGFSFDSLLPILVTAGISALMTWFWFVRNQKAKGAEKREAERAELIDRITQLEKQAAMLDHTVTPLSAAFQKMLVDQLTHYHAPEMDALMGKLTGGTLTADEKARLLVLLEERTKEVGDEISPSERNAAAMLPMVMQRVEEEAELLKVVQPVLAVVAIPVVTPEGKALESKPAGGKAPEPKEEDAP